VIAMTDDPLNEFGFVIRRKRVEEVPTYICAICTRTVRPDRWQDSPDYLVGPICRRCAHNWGYSNSLNAFHKNDRARVFKLRALVSAFDWLVKNVRYQ
jgi:hypothetical protein